MPNRLGLTRNAHAPEGAVLAKCSRPGRVHNRFANQARPAVGTAAEDVPIGIELEYPCGLSIATVENSSNLVFSRH